MNPEILRRQWDRVLAIVAAVAGAVALLLGWIGVSGSSLVTQQLPYLASGAAVGLVLFGVATTLWLSADIRDEWAKLDDIYTELIGQRQQRDNHSAPTTEQPVLASDDVSEEIDTGRVARSAARRSSKPRRMTGLPTP